MALETFDYADGTDAATITGFSVENGAFQISGGELAPTSVNTSTVGGAYFLNDLGSNIVTASVDVISNGYSGTSTAGIVGRYVDNDNNLQAIIRASDGFTFILERVNGTATVLADGTPSGFTPGDNVNITMEDDGESIGVLVDGVQVVSYSTTRHQGATLYGPMATNAAFSFDNYSYPDAPVAGLKEASITLPAAFIGLGGVKYSLSVLSTGEQVDFGTLDTASSPVTVQFENDFLSDGVTLVAYASNITSSNDTEALIMWDKTTLSIAE